MRKTVKKKGNTSPGSLMKRGPEYRPIGGDAKKRQTRPKHTHAKALSVPQQTHRDYGKNLGHYLHKSKLPTGAKIGMKRKSNKPRSYYV